MIQIKPGFFLFTIALFIICTVQVQAVPPLPAEYYGNVLIEGTPAPAGTVITAYIHGTPRGTITTDVAGFYGGPGLFDPRLKVNVSETELQAGDLIITFQINGILASQSIPFTQGASQQLDLSTGQTGSNNSFQGLTPIPVKTEEPIITNTNTPNTKSEPYQDNEGSSPSIQYGLEQEEKYTSDDGMAFIVFQKGTLLFSPKGEFLQNITIAARKIADLAPIRANQSLFFSGYAYEINPERTYFNPEGQFSLQIPYERISEVMALNPQIYRYVPQTASWEQLRTSTNQFTGVISAPIYEAAIYALFLENKTSVSAPTTPPPTQPTPLPTLAPIAGQPVIPQYPHSPMTAPQQPPNPPLESQQRELTPQIQESITRQETNQPENATAVTTPAVTLIPSTPNRAEPVQNPTQEITSTQQSDQSTIPLVGNLTESAKKILYGPIGILFGLVLLIIVINAGVYLFYTRWWLGRNP